ncbi:MAG: glycosyltransferase family 4 protein [Patescibacteria group bacterium]|jgi:glycosyltransferase involved in cell wall biosynthesis
MKLLMITRKVDRYDPLAGFAYGWVKKIAANVSQLKVLCLEKGDVSELPNNVEIYSLGKEKGTSRLARFWRFQILALKLVPKVDGVFCHMNPEYTIAIAPYAKIFGKKIVSWYTHGKVTPKLKVMEKITDVILTASKESFRLPSKKLVVTGHGIDTAFFHPPLPGQETISKFYLAGRESGNLSAFKILSIGRISPTKDYESLIKAVDILVNEQKVNSLQVNIIGGPGLPKHQVYLDNLKKMVEAMKLQSVISFSGAISNIETVGYYQDADLFINLSHTGSVDKTVLEAMSCGSLVLTSNEAFVPILGLDFMVLQNDFRKLAEKIRWVMNLVEPEKQKIKEKLRQEVIDKHDLTKLAVKIVEQYAR